MKWADIPKEDLRTVECTLLAREAAAQTPRHIVELNPFHTAPAFHFCSGLFVSAEQDIQRDLPATLCNLHGLMKSSDSLYILS